MTMLHVSGFSVIFLDLKGLKLIEREKGGWKGFLFDKIDSMYV